METIIQLHKKSVLILLSTLLLIGCSKQEVAEVTPENLLEKLQEVNENVVTNHWDELSQMMRNTKNAAENLQTAWNQTGQTSCQVLSQKIVNQQSGIAELSCDQNNVLMQVDFDDSLKVSSITFEILPEHLTVESNEIYEETLITLSSTPTLEGILTIPVGSEYPPVAILMPEGMNEAADASGSDLSFRKDLAHALAEKGIASVRFHMPAYINQKLLTAQFTSFDALFDQEFAKIVHSLETYPVDATTILYIGHGNGGTLGYYNVMQHYEIDGGLVLLNSRMIDGLQMMQDTYQFDQAIIDEVTEKLSEDEFDGNQIVDAFTLSYFSEWYLTNPLNYTRYVTMPIAIFTGSQESETTKEEIDLWRSQKGSNVSMVEIENANHTMRDSDGNIRSQCIEYIYLWLNGEDIEEIESETE